VYVIFEKLKSIRDLIQKDCAPFPARNDGFGGKVMS